MDYPYLYLAFKPYCICVESQFFYNGQIEKFVSFFSDHKLDFTYSFYYVQFGVRLIFTFKFD